MTTIGAPRAIWESDFLKAFYAGWGKLAQDFGVELIGGDISRTPDKVVIDSIVGGEVAKGKAVLRRGARPGDSIFVTGHLGGAAGGLRLLESKVRNRDFSEMENALVERQLTPTPRVEIGRSILNANAASAMIDLSDGLSSDLAHLCTASGVGACIDASLIPVDHNLSALGLGADEVLELALNGGEDFELLFTADEKKITPLNFREFHRVGVVTANVGMIELTDGSKTTQLAAKGYRHF
jgi:thiamine-monophosphate kinase